MLQFLLVKISFRRYLWGFTCYGTLGNAPDLKWGVGVFDSIMDGLCSNKYKRYSGVVFATIMDAIMQVPKPGLQSKASDLVSFEMRSKHRTFVSLTFKSGVYSRFIF